MGLSGLDGIALRRFDTRTGSLLFSQGVVTQGIQAAALCIENGGIWAANFETGKIQKFDLSNGSVLEEVNVETHGPMGLKFGGGHLWVGMIGANAKVVRF